MLCRQDKVCFSRAFVEDERSKQNPSHLSDEKPAASEDLSSSSALSIEWGSRSAQYSSAVPLPGVCNSMNTSTALDSLRSEPEDAKGSGADRAPRPWHSQNLLSLNAECLEQSSIRSCRECRLRLEKTNLDAVALEQDEARLGQTEVEGQQRYRCTGTYLRTRSRGRYLRTIAILMPRRIVVNRLLVVSSNRLRRQATDDGPAQD